MNANKRDSYKEEIIDPNDRASKFARDICFASHKNSDLVRIVPHQPGNFRGPVGFVWTKDILEQMADYYVEDGKVVEWSVMEEVENDGAGGKPQFFTLLGEAEAFRNLGWEIICMTADDFARSGRLPVVIANDLNVKGITDANFHLFQALMEGYGAALAKAGLVNITGEIAVMKHSITAFCDDNRADQLVLTWGASCIGLADRTKLIDGSRIEPCMPVIGLHEHGYRCNGGTLLTNITLDRWGPDPCRAVKENEEARDFVRRLTVPSVSYASFITDLIGWRNALPGRGIFPDIRGIAHITGGGVWGKFKEMLPPGVGANLYAMPRPPQVLLNAQLYSLGTRYELSDWQGYSTFHGGCGMLMVCAPGSELAILQHAQAVGIAASVVGITTKSECNEILTISRFRTDKMLSSESPE